MISAGMLPNITDTTRKGCQMDILIETNFVPLIFSTNLPEGITIGVTYNFSKRDSVSESIATAVFIIGSGATAQVLGSWIYEQLKKYKDKTYIKIEHEEVSIDKSEIIRVVRSKIEIKKG
jgi:hypothetical protein